MFSQTFRLRRTLTRTLSLPREQNPGFRRQKARHKNKGQGWDETAGADYRPTITTACRESERALATYDHITNGSGIQFRAGQEFIRKLFLSAGFSHAGITPNLLLCVYSTMTRENNNMKNFGTLMLFISYQTSTVFR